MFTLIILNRFLLVKDYATLTSMKVTKAVQKKTRYDILTASLEEFASQGFQGASLRSIAKKAGVSLGVTYNYFKNKDDILKELIVNFYSHREAVIALATKNLSNTEAPILTYLNCLITDIKMHEEMYRLYMSLILQPNIMKRLKGNEKPFAEIQNKDKKLFHLISKTAKKDLGIEGPLIMVIAVGMISVYLANERSIHIEEIPYLLTNSFPKRSHNF